MVNLKRRTSLKENEVEKESKKNNDVTKQKPEKKVKNKVKVKVKEKVVQFFQGNKSASIYDPKKQMLVISAEKKVFTTSNPADIALLIKKGYERIKKTEEG